MKTGESTLYLSVLLVSVGFFALLISAASAGFSYDMDSVVPAAPTPHVKTKFEREVGKMVEGSPIAEMVPYIAKQDPETAKYLVSIAKHESNWGKYSRRIRPGRPVITIGDSVEAATMSPRADIRVSEARKRRSRPSVRDLITSCMDSRSTPRGNLLSGNAAPRAPGIPKAT